MSLLKGRAEQAIKGYFDDPGKYEKALQVLQTRFGNNRLVSIAYLTYFLDTKDPEDNADAMRKHFDRQLNAAGTLNMYKEDDDSLKLAICEKTLSPTMKKEWEKKYEEITRSKKIVKFEDTSNFTMVKSQVGKQQRMLRYKLVVTRERKMKINGEIQLKRDMDIYLKGKLVFHLCRA